MLIHILQAPLAETTDSDISLMHLVAGHFNNLEFMDPKLNFPFVRQLAGLALKTVSSARAQSVAACINALPDLDQNIAFDLQSPLNQVRIPSVLVSKTID